MRTPTMIAGHPLHPMLIVLPLGMWAYSFVAQIISLNSESPAWYATALYTAGGGIVGALLAAIPGVIDVFSIRDRRLRRIGYTHMALNLTATALWAVAFYLLLPDQFNQTWAFIFSLAAVLILSYSGWLGAALVHVHRVAVLEPHEQEHGVTTPTKMPRA